eukprot:c24635_g1_i3 orf=281-2089(+)
MQDRRGSLLLIPLIFLFRVLRAEGELTPKGVNFEVQALMAFKAEVVDPENALASWDGNAVDPCGWYHVTCSSKLFVMNVVLPNLQLFGTLSPSIGNLTNLEILMLENNNISGPIPSELGKLFKLSSLDLSNNRLSGQIPHTLGQLKSLTYLRLNNNSLSGSFPASLADIHGLDFVIAGNPLLCGSNTSLDCPANDPSLSVSISVNSSSGASTLNRSKIAALAVGVSGFVVLLAFTSIAVCLWKRRCRQQVFFDANEQRVQEVCLGQLKKFTFKELQIATDNFHGRNILGRGGFGNVYKGCMSDSSVIAVKRLKDRNASGGEVQFQMEVEMISLAVHRNLLRLLGYCVTATERLLVYPYMRNGSVESRLREKPSLGWSARKKIALGAARGLLYLHEQCDPKIIHRDVKAANILLDEDYEAVVCDFGLAKLLDHGESHVTTAVRGTVGHIAPEYLSTGQSSEKTDAYGFGILLLELITGQRAIEFGRLSNQRGHMLLDWVKKLQQENRLDELVDAELRDLYNALELEEIVQVALLCTQFLPTDRPKMSEVVRMLEGDGLSERWEAWKRVESDRCQDIEMQSQRYYDLAEDSSLVLEPTELSGPR